MRQKMNEDRADRTVRRRRLANGSYALAAGAIAIAAVLLVNLIVQTVPPALTTLDLTDQKLYSIGATTKGVLDSLDRDVKLYFLSESGQEDEGVSKLLDSYDGYSGHISVEKVDAVANPLFAQQFDEAAIALNSVVAVSGERSKVASYNDFYQYDYSGYSYNAAAWDAEGQITSAIAYVTSDSTSKIYYTVGHSELALGPELTDAIGKANAELQELNLISSKIPEDCTALILFAPGEDLTKEEVKKVFDYLDNGGNALVVSMAELVNGRKLPNFDSIMESYGIKKAEGIVMEDSESHYVQAPYLIVPEVASNTEITAALGNSNIIYSLAEGLVPTEDDEAPYAVMPLLTSSENAYLKNDLSGTVTKESGDESGQFALAVAVEQTFSNDSYGASDIAQDDADAALEELLGDAAEDFGVGAEAGSGDGAEDTGSGAEEVSGVATEASSDEVSGAHAEDHSGDTESEPRSTRILYYTSPCALNSDALSSLIQQSTALPEGNSALVTESIAYLTDQKVVLSVPPKTLSTPQTTIDAGTVSVLGALFMYILPAAVLILGFVIWMKRRKR